MTFTRLWPILRGGSRIHQYLHSFLQLQILQVHFSIGFGQSFGGGCTAQWCGCIWPFSLRGGSRALHPLVSHWHHCLFPRLIACPIDKFTTGYCRLQSRRKFLFVIYFAIGLVWCVLLAFFSAGWLPKLAHHTFPVPWQPVLEILDLQHQRHPVLCATLAFYTAGWLLNFVHTRAATASATLTPQTGLTPQYIFDYTRFLSQNFDCRTGWCAILAFFTAGWLPFLAYHTLQVTEHQIFVRHILELLSVPLAFYTAGWLLTCAHNSKATERPSLSHPWNLPSPWISILVFYLQSHCAQVTVQSIPLAFFTAGWLPIPVLCTITAACLLDLATPAQFRLVNHCGQFRPFFADNELVGTLADPFSGPLHCGVAPGQHFLDTN